jgi:CRP-like cAMP-binding protein
MDINALGKVYQDGEAIITQGEVGDCMYVIQSGKVEVIQKTDGNEVKLAELGKGDFFGEIALFESVVRTATVRAVGEVRVLTLDKKTLLRKIREDPSFAFNIMRKMSSRTRSRGDELTRIKSRGDK